MRLPGWTVPKIYLRITSYVHGYNNWNDIFTYIKRKTCEFGLKIISPVKSSS